MWLSDIELRCLIDILDGKEKVEDVQVGRQSVNSVRETLMWERLLESHPKGLLSCVFWHKPQVYLQARW